MEVTDRVGLLHDVTQALWERELTGETCLVLSSLQGRSLSRPDTSVHRAHVSTSPSNHAVDLFYITGAATRLVYAQRHA